MGICPLAGEANARAKLPECIACPDNNRDQPANEHRRVLCGRSLFFLVVLNFIKFLNHPIFEFFLFKVKPFLSEFSRIVNLKLKSNKWFVFI